MVGNVRDKYKLYVETINEQLDYDTAVEKCARRIEELFYEALDYETSKMWMIGLEIDRYIRKAKVDNHKVFIKDVYVKAQLPISLKTFYDNYEFYKWSVKVFEDLKSKHPAIASSFGSAPEFWSSIGKEIGWSKVYLLFKARLEVEDVVVWVERIKSENLSFRELKEELRRKYGKGNRQPLVCAICGEPLAWKEKNVEWKYYAIHKCCLEQVLGVKLEEEGGS